MDGRNLRVLRLTVDVIDLYEPGTPERRAAYHADITYGTNNEFGFHQLPGISSRSQID